MSRGACVIGGDGREGGAMKPCSVSGACGFFVAALSSEEARADKEDRIYVCMCTRFPSGK